MKIYAQQITREKALVYDLRAMVNGEKRYFIVKVSPAKRTAFLHAVEKDAGFRLEDYGDIIHRGWNEPEDGLKAMLREKYGMYQEEIVS
ncbi:MAG: hypothetical protein J0M34_00975 [Alphaproteobacteria bacterium]|nr:hypothetical protein [Alphaproteobacteria bacterium]